MTDRDGGDGVGTAAPEAEAATPVTQRISEVSLALRNLGYTLSLVACDADLRNSESFAGGLVSLHEQVQTLADQLEDLSAQCRACMGGGAIYRTPAEAIAAPTLHEPPGTFAHRLAEERPAARPADATDGEAGEA